MTSKEALERLQKHFASPYNSGLLEMLNIIKQDIERLEKENQELWYNISKQAYLLNSKHIDSPFIERYQKAIEILKDKPFVLEFGLSVFEWYEEEKIYYYSYEYTEYFGEDLVYRCKEYYLTQQEYEIIKEVLE